jgi:hypothetical protein
MRGRVSNHCGDDVQAAPHRALGILLVGARKAEGGQDAVTHELGNKAVISSDGLPIAGRRWSASSSFLIQNSFCAHWPISLAPMCARGLEEPLASWKPAPPLHRTWEIFNDRPLSTYGPLVVRYSRECIEHPMAVERDCWRKLTIRQTGQRQLETVGEQHQCSVFDMTAVRPLLRRAAALALFRC